MKIWGDKTEALFDIWSIEHFISGVTIGSILCVIIVHYCFPNLKNRDNKRKKDAIKKNLKGLLFHYFAIIFLIAYVWEVLEFYMEAGYTNEEKITHWFQGVEFWLNRSVTDPLMVAFGAWCTLRFYSSSITWSARVFSVTWLGFHVFVFPNCMYLQDSLAELYNSDNLQVNLHGMVATYEDFFLRILG